MLRPRLDERLTIRLPGALLADYLQRAADRNCSLNETVLNALEKDAAQAILYQVDYYQHLRPLLQLAKGDVGALCPPGHGHRPNGYGRRATDLSR